MSTFQKMHPRALWHEIRRPMLALILVVGVLMGSFPVSAISTTVSDGQNIQTSTDEVNPNDADGKFTIAIIPDTQQEVLSGGISLGLFRNRMDWLANNKDSLDLRQIIHTGDKVNWGWLDPSQLICASDAYRAVDNAKIPYISSIGNHDTAAVGVGGSAYDATRTSLLVRDTSAFNKYFPVKRSKDLVTFEPDKVDNAYQTFTAAGKKWLVISLEFCPRTVAINWAKTVVEQHLDYNVIISTHSYISGSGSIGGSAEYGENSPQYLYDNLIKVYPNIRFVFCGHVDAAGKREDIGINGNKIVTVLGCFHSSTTNPTQLMEIDTNLNTAKCKFYAPYTNYEWTQYAYNFTGLNFVSPSSSKPALIDRINLSKQEKQKDYSPTSFGAMLQAQSAAVAVRDNSSATELQYTDVKDTLNTAMANLEPPLVGKSWEFGTDGNTEGWTATKVNGLTTAGGYLVGEANDASNPFDARLQSPIFLNLDPEYSILRYRAKVSNSAYSTFTGGTAYFNRDSDGDTISAERAVNYPDGMMVKGNTGFEEYTIDLSSNTDWNNGIYTMWMDPIRGPNGTNIEIDYVRFYKKGNCTLTYNANAGNDTVTKMPADDTMAAVGEGYMLSGQVPFRTGYVFKGWSETIDGEAVDTIDITGNKVVYAKWAVSYDVTATFSAGKGTGTIAPIISDAYSTITLPTLGSIARTGYAFAGWNNGIRVYQPGAEYTLGDADVTFTATWSPVKIVSFAAEFSNASEANLWLGTPQVKTVENGALKLELQVKDARLQYVLTDGTDGKEPFDSAFNLMKIRYKKTSTGATGMLRWQRTIDPVPVGTADVVAAEQGARRYQYTFTSSTASDTWYEKTYDLSALATWNGDIRSFWFDPCEKTDASAAAPGKIEYDYIRFYRKGANTVTYNQNTAETVTGMPANDTMAAIGTGYMLSGQFPSRTGYDFVGWSTSASGSVVAGNSIDISANTNIYAIWKLASNQAVATFTVGDGIGTPPAAMTATIGSSITLPVGSGVTKAGYIFSGWNDGNATYQPGASYTLTANKIFTPVWQINSSSPIMGKAWEFTSGVDGWGVQQKISSLTAANGILTAVSNVPIEGPYFDSRIVSPADLKLDPAYNILKIRMRNTGAKSNSTVSFFFTRTTDGTGISSGTGARTVKFNLQSDVGWVEYTYDLSQFTNANGNWNSEIYRLWMDPILGPIGATADIDYIRIYRKGSNTLNYNANAGSDTVTKMPTNDTNVAIGQGYLLSGQIPYREGYLFDGWAASADGAVIPSNTIDISGAVTTVYAKWHVARNVNAIFVNNPNDLINPPLAVITVPEYSTITFPTNLPVPVKPGATFAGWTDGTSIVGPTYQMGNVDVTFYPAWVMQAPVFSPASDAVDVDFRNLSIQVTFPVDVDPATLTPANFNATWVQNITYNTSTKTATIYLKQESLKYNTVVSFPFIKNVLSADHSQFMTIRNYSFTTMVTPPDDGQNLVSNGNFELPFVPAYNVDTMELSTDTPSGSGHSLKVTASAAGQYTQPKFNIYYKPNTVYYYEYDAKVTGNTVGNANASSQVMYASKLNAGNDIPLNNPAPTAIKVSDGWKHYSGYTNQNTQSVNLVTGSTYMFLYTNPFETYGVSFLLDNVVVKEAYLVSFAGGGSSVTGAIDSVYRPMGDTVTLPTSGFACAGSTFSGWTDGFANYAPGATYTVPIGGATLTALWVSDTYTLRFNENTTDVVDNMPPALPLNKGQSYLLADLGLTDPVRSGYTFLGWSIDGVNIATEVTLTEDMTLFALWQANPVAIGIFGDANGDGIITVYDAVIILQIVAGVLSPTATQTFLCNVNGDTGVTAFDAVLVLQYMTDISTGYPTGEIAHESFPTV